MEECILPFDFLHFEATFQQLLVRVLLEEVSCFCGCQDTIAQGFWKEISYLKLKVELKDCSIGALEIRDAQVRKRKQKKVVVQEK